MNCKYTCFSLLLITLVLSCSTKQIYDNALIVKGGTIIDVSDNGTSLNDLIDKAIIIKSDTIFKIIEVSSLSSKQDNIIDATGKFIMPGLTDGFAVINNQSYANAFLYMGITDVIGVESFRRGKFYHDANPSPNVHMLEAVGDTPVTNQQILDTIQKHHKNNVEILLMMYKLTPLQLEFAHSEAKKLGMGTIGELGFTSYKEGMDLGVDAFVHTTRYSLDIAPDSMAAKVAEQPFSNDLGSPKWRYYQYLTNLKEGNEALLQHAKNLGNSNSYIMPTFGLLYIDMPFSKNPWNEKVASIIDIDDVNRPANKITGKHNYPPEELVAYQKLGFNELMIEKTYYNNGAHYISGSGTDVWGTMPGISLHQELEVLSRIGLTNREVLATSTSNFNAAFGLKFGKLESGFRANILILNNNPLDDITNLKGKKIVILNGKQIDVETLLNN